jgi:hypothetical protein
MSYTDEQVIEFIEQQFDNNNPISLRQIAKAFNTSHAQIKRILIRNNYYEEYLKRKEDIINKQSSDNNQQEEITEERYKELTEISFLKEQVKYWKRLYNQTIKHSSFENKIIDLFERHLVKYKPVFNIQQNNDIELIENEEPVLILSDLHIGGDVDKEEVMGLNEYNLEIAKNRLEIVYNKFIKILKRFEYNNHKYKKVNLFLIGDFVEGVIHQELLQGMPIVDQVIETANLVSDIIYKLSQQFEEVEVYGVIGNHGRIDKKVYYKNKYSNFDYLVYKFIEVKCSNLNNVKCYFPKSSMLIVNKFNKWNFLLRHGDGKSQSFAGIPIYGIVRQSTKIQQMFNAYKDIYIHYQILGHYHSNMQIPYPAGQVIVCGSLKGIDEFSFNNFLASEPSQTMLIINKKTGIFARFDLFCN